MARRINQVTPATNTVAGNQRGATGAGMFHRDWDKKAGAEQMLSRTTKRYSQGQKMTPLGSGKMTKG